MCLKKHGIKVFGLSLLAALGLMALTATGAQAGEYTVEGKTFTSKAIASETVSGGTSETSKILVPGLSLTIECKKGKVSGSILLGGVTHLTTLLEECSVEGNKLCKTYETKAKMETGSEPGFLTGSGLGETVLMGGVHWWVILIKMTIYFEKSTKGCTLPLEEVLEGCWTLKIPTFLIPSIIQKFLKLFQFELETLFPSNVLKYGNQTAWLDGGELSLSLSGANTGKTWGGE